MAGLVPAEEVDVEERKTDAETAQAEWEAEARDRMLANQPAWDGAAEAAIAGLTSDENRGWWTPSCLAEKAADYADAMLYERQKRRGEL